MNHREWMISEATAVLARFDAEGCPVSWMSARLADDAQRLPILHPPTHQEVMGWVSDVSVCIWFFPTVVRWDGHSYWAGLPASWIDLRAKKWVLTHWKAIA